MVATFSPEGRIVTGLRLLCSHRSFVEIARALGVQISHGPFNEAVNGKKPLEREVGERLLEILSRMQELQNEVGLPLNWSKTEEIAMALTIRLTAQIARELEIENPEIQNIAARATKEVAHV
jgi:hypothetical protein